MAGPEVHFKPTEEVTGALLDLQLSTAIETQDSQVRDVFVGAEQIALGAAMRVRCPTPLERLHDIEEAWQITGTSLNPRYF